MSKYKCIVQAFQCLAFLHSRWHCQFKDKDKLMFQFLVYSCKTLSTLNIKKQTIIEWISESYKLSSKPDEFFEKAFNQFLSVNNLSYFCQKVRVTMVVLNIEFYRTFALCYRQWQKAMFQEWL